MNTSQNFLISIQGVTTENDVLERFTGQLEHLSFSIQDLHYLNFQSSLSILMRLELEQSTDKESLNKVLDKVAKQFKLELLIYPLPERSSCFKSSLFFNLVEPETSTAITDKTVLSPQRKATLRNRNQSIGRR